MRLIDADALKVEIRKAFPSLCMRIEINTIVNDAPTIEIVRCRDCKYWDDTQIGDIYCSLLEGLCDISGDSFCSYGEKQTEPNSSEKPNNCKDEPQTERIE